ncbi:MAG: DMT family transporter [Chloroflexota bacterium]|nr:DMT family transporter [Chloroflexota bacterium]MBI5704226.1 DMT family transporter [Chloroflexota bacterium]
MSKKNRSQGISAALISAALIGMAPVFGKAAMGEGQFSPYAVVALRTSMATALLVLIMLVFKRQYLYIYPAGLYGCLLAGALNGIGSIFYYVGLSKLNASVAQMLYALYPLFVALWLQLDGQPPSKLTLLRIIIAGGSAFLLTKVESGNINLTGVIFMLISAALYALHLPINQRVLYDVPAPTVTVYTLLAMSAVVVPAYFIASPAPPADPSWLPVLGLTAVTFGSRLMLFLGVKNIGGMQTALLGLAELLVAITFSHLLLGETLTRWQWMGTTGLGASLLLVWFEKPISHPLRAKGLLSWLQPPDFPSDFYRH